jgi:tetratricopeptide (TPR) repeat protein
MDSLRGKDGVGPNWRADWVDRLSKSVHDHESSRRLWLSTIPRYEFLERLGRGGMGAVYRAMDRVLSREVALKVLVDPLGAPAEARGRFLQEARLAATLQHPNIVPIFDAGEHEGQVFLAMQLIDGSGLEHRKMALREAAEAVRDAARAVHYAHERGIIHRDLKPSNVMIDTTGRVFVTDFGLARRSDSAARMTLTGTIVGTPIYMPPEQARGAETDARSDVYSLGATLYELASGQAPFSGANELEILKHVLLDEPPFPRKHAPALPQDLESVILKAMDKKPSGRYPTAAALADDLDRWLRSEPVHAPVRGAFYRVRKKIVRHRWRVLAIAATVGFLIMTAAFSWAYVRAYRTYRQAMNEPNPDRKLDLLTQAATHSKPAQEERVRLLEKRDRSRKQKEQEGIAKAEQEKNEQLRLEKEREEARAEEEIRQRETRELNELVGAFHDAMRERRWVDARARADELRRRNHAEHDKLQADLRTAEFDDGIERLRKCANQGSSREFQELFAIMEASQYKAQRDWGLRLAQVCLDLVANLDRGPGEKIVWLKKAEALGETKASLYSQRGRLYLGMGSYEEAYADYKRYRDLAPKAQPAPEFSELLVHLAGGERQKKNWSGALALLKEALEINSKDAGALRLQGIVQYLAGGSPEAALQAYAVLKRVKPESEPATEHLEAAWRHLRAVAAQTWELKDPSAARTERLQAVALTERVLSSIQGEPAAPLLELARMRRRVGQLKEAFDDARRAKDSAESHLVRSQILHAQSATDGALLRKALEEADLAATADPKLARVWYWRAVLRDALDLPDVLGDLKEAQRLGFTGPEFLLRLAQFAAQEGSSDEVLRLTSKALESPSPGEEEFLALSAEQRKESPAQVANSLRASAHATRGRGYLQKSDLPRCLTECEAALALEPDNWVGRYHRGLACYTVGQYDRAIADFSRLIELNNQDYRAYAARGSAFLKKNNRENAKEDYDKALKFAPPHWDQRSTLEANRKKM